MAICGVALPASLLMAQETNRPSSHDRAIASTRSNDWVNAISSFNEAIQNNPKDPLVYEYRGGAYFAQGHLDRAISDFTKAIQLDPENARFFCHRGTAYRAKREFKQAILDFNEALRLCPTNAGAYMQRAAVYNATGDVDRSIADWNAGLSLNPGNAAARAMRGNEYSRKGEYEKAVSDFGEAIRLDPSNHLGYSGLGWLRATCPKAEFRDGKEAVAEATKACELTAWVNWARIDTLAAAHAEAGDFQKAVGYQKSAIRMKGATKEDRADMQKRLTLYERQQPFREGLEK